MTRSGDRTSWRGTSVPRRWLTCARGALAALILFLLTLQGAAGHAALDTSSPASGQVLTEAPGEVVATFTEPLEQGYSRMELFDSQGNLVEDTELTFGDDGYTMTLALPDGLAPGTWSVLWRTLSTADGHPAQNYFTFTVGTGADIVPVVIPGSALDGGEAPPWASTTSRWAAYLGVAALIACWPVWWTVLRPALGPSWRYTVPIVRRMRRFALWATVLAAAGSIYALVVQAMTLTDGTLLERVVNTLGQTRYGHLWLARFGLIVGLGLVLAACGWWFTRRRQVEGLLAWTLAAALTIPFSLIAHASAHPGGRTFAIAADAIHLFGSALWAGGLAMLAFVIVPHLRRLEPERRRALLARLIPRFSVMALIALSAVSLTGLYAGWLHVGNLAALRSTDYGRALIVKLAIFAIILVLAGVNLLVIERKLHQPGPASPWTRRFRWTVAGELVLVALLLLVVGRLTALPPARDVMVERSRQVTIAIETEPRSSLILAPGVAGVNHFRLEVGGPALPVETEALLRLTIPGRGELGTREVQLSRVSGNAFEHHGSEIGIADDWEITAIIREPGAAQVSASTVVEIGLSPPDVNVPGYPWRFETLGGITGMTLVLAGIASLIVAARTASRTTRKETGGLGTAAILLGVILLMQARIDPVLANAPGQRAIDPTDVAMVERGEEVYRTHCLTCHGPELRGDGPAGGGMQPPPADFSAPHTRVHSDEDNVYWVVNGKQGTAMPAFRDVLSDQDVRDVLSFIEARQEHMSGLSLSGEEIECTARAMTVEELGAMTGAGHMVPPGTIEATNLVDDDAILEGIEVTTRQLVACTNAMETMRRLSLFTGRYLHTAFADGVPPGFGNAPADPASLPVEQQLTLTGIRDVTMLADGRVLATVEIVDPANHFHGPGSTPESGDTGIVEQLVFAREGDAWLIDDILGGE